MRITKDTTYEELSALRKSFAPRWETEAAKVREARVTLTGEALAQAEQAYADFETVATAVIAITDLRQIYEEAAAQVYEHAADLVEGSEPAATEELTPEERDQRAQGHYSGPDMTPGDNANRAPTQGEIFNRLEQELKADFHDLLKNKVTPELEKAYHFARQGNWKQSLHMMEHAVDYILQVLRRSNPENMSQLSEERKNAFVTLPERENLESLYRSCIALDEEIRLRKHGKATTEKLRKLCSHAQDLAAKAAGF